MSHFKAVLLCEAGMRFKYPHPMELAELLRQDGISVEIGGPQDPDVLRWNAFREVPYRTLTDNRLGILLMPPQFHLRTILMEEEVRVLVPFTTVSLVAALLRKLVLPRTEVIYYALELMPPLSPRSGFYALAQWVLPWLNLRVFTTGPYRSRFLQRCLGLRHLPGVIRCAAIDRKRPRSTDLRSHFEQTCGWRPHLLLVSSGGLAPGNLIHQIIESSMHWPEGVGLCLVGLPEMPGLEKLVEEANEQKKRVYLHGPVVGSRDGLISVLQSADIGFVIRSTSREEIPNERLYTPNKAFDFIAAGIPFICLDISEMRHFVRNGVARSVGTCSPAEITLAVHELASNPAMIEKMRANIKALQTNEYSYQHQSLPLRELIALKLKEKPSVL